MFQTGYYKDSQNSVKSKIYISVAFGKLIPENISYFLIINLKE